jgi:hypothetical protein
MKNILMSLRDVLGYSVVKADANKIVEVGTVVG